MVKSLNYQSENNTILCSQALKLRKILYLNYRLNYDKVLEDFNDYYKLQVGIIPGYQNGELESRIRDSENKFPMMLTDDWIEQIKPDNNTNCNTNVYGGTTDLLALYNILLTYGIELYVHNVMFKDAIFEYPFFYSESEKIKINSDKFNYIYDNPNSIFIKYSPKGLHYDSYIKKDVVNKNEEILNLDEVSQQYEIVNHSVNIENTNRDIKKYKDEKKTSVKFLQEEPKEEKLLLTSMSNDSLLNSSQGSPPMDLVSTSA